MPNMITFTTDDPALAARILQVIQGGAKPSAAEAPASAPPATAAASAVPHAGNSATPPMPSQPSSPQFAQPPSGVGLPGAEAQPGVLQQAIEATNAALDKYLQNHKATEAKTVLQKYGLKRISDATDMAILQNIHREFSGQ